MGKLSQFRLDNETSVEGIWVKFGAGIEIKIARMNNPEFVRHYDEISQPFLSQLRKRTAGRETTVDLMRDAVAHCIIKDWKNMEDDSGKAIKYSPEKALEIINDPANVIFYDFVLDVAGSAHLFFEKQKEEAVKN